MISLRVPTVREGTTGRDAVRRAGVVLLLAAYWLMAVTGVAHKSPTDDEPFHLTAGYCFWKLDDYRLNISQGNLPSRWASLPLLLGNYRLPSFDQPAWRTGMQWDYGKQFLYDVGNDAQSMLLQGRAMIALMGAALCAVAYFWSRRLFGRTGGIVTLVLAAFCPNLLAHGSLVTSDVVVTLFFALSLWCLWRLMHRVSPGSLLASCLAMGGLFLSKMSAGLIIPMAVLILGVRLARGLPLTIAFGKTRRLETRARQAGVLLATIPIHVLAVGLLIWASYGFRYSPYSVDRAGPGRFYEPWDKVLTDAGAMGSAVEYLRDHHALPEAYLYGLAHARKHAQSPVAFLNGSCSTIGWWYFFPYTLLVKTPLPLLGLLVSAGAAAVTRIRLAARAGSTTWRALAESTYATAPLWILLLVYWAAAIRSNLNIGVRHLLPTYPAMFILAGACGFWFERPGRTRLIRLAVAALAGGFAVCSLWMWPNYLAYFNRLAGGPANGYRHLVDSSLDWGQDLPGLKRWLDRRGLTRQHQTPTYLIYFGQGSPTYYDIDATVLPRKPTWDAEFVPTDLRAGIYCISATLFQLFGFYYAGPQRNATERQYQELRREFDEFFRRMGEPAMRDRLKQGDAANLWGNRHRDFDLLRVARLCRYLRDRRPDDQIGYSILVFKLSNEDIRQALFGPTP